MKNLSFFKGLIIGSIISISVWVIAASAVTSVWDSNTPTVPTKSEVQSKIYATNPPA